MVDVVTPEVRSRMMAGIGAKNTRPEMTIRRALHAKGFRFRLHRRDLPGRPDIVLSRYQAAIFVNGCFWHGHECALFKWPKTRVEFWRTKIEHNRTRDEKALDRLGSLGWRRAVLWECAIKGPSRLPLDALIDSCSNWLLSDDAFVEVRGVTQ